MDVWRDHIFHRTSNRSPGREEGWSWNEKLKQEDSSEWARRQKVVGGIYFTKNITAKALRPDLKIDKFKPRLRSGIFKCISWLTGSVFPVQSCIRALFLQFFFSFLQTWKNVLASIWDFSNFKLIFYVI